MYADVHQLPFNNDMPAAALGHVTSMVADSRMLAVIATQSG